MDSMLIDYLRSGKAWVLVGSGPSIEMGYPDWRKLALCAMRFVESDGQRSNLIEINEAYKQNDFPKVFQEAQKVIDIKSLIYILDEKLKSSESGKIYELLARWPIDVYLTTNYDDEIQNHLAKVGVAYRSYSNSEDSLSRMLPDLSGAIFKLHGDFKSEKGLVLTASHYDEIQNSSSWEYWRTKLVSVFQMKPVVIIGHSLSDPHIQHILRAAKKGAGVIQPICWIAPDVDFEDKKKFLEEYRIRVISYNNRNGNHKNLVHLINFISEFIPPRSVIQIETHIAEVSTSPLGRKAAAPGFFVFNKLNASTDIDKKRVDVALAALQAIIPELVNLEKFEIEEALRIAGWPKGTSLTSNFTKLVGREGVKQGLFEKKEGKYKVCNKANSIVSKSEKEFQHLRGRFHESLVLRVKRLFTEIKHAEAEEIALDIEASLSGYFREGGLTLATALFATSKAQKENTLPRSIVKFISEASARYDDSLRRQAFCTVSLDAFIKAESAEREFLGRVSQGFFAFHALGVFGDAAAERLRQVKSTVWLIDSSSQIPAIALAAPTQGLFRDCFSTLNSLGVRLFTTERLFDETWDHLQFARTVIKQHGSDSYNIIAAAKGDSPYQKSNQFMEGFVRWQAGGNPCDWDSYLFSIFQTTTPRKDDLKSALQRIGIEVISYESWPGFHDHDFSDRELYTKKIAQKLLGSEIEIDFSIDDTHRKALPEAEAFVIIRDERDGKYHILSQPSEKSSAWFISNTSMLNLLAPGLRITWQPDAFIRFTTTFYHGEDTLSTNRAFETILWGIAQSGLNILDESAIVKVFGGIIDQAKISYHEQCAFYEKTLAEKYGESLDAVLERLSPARRPLAMLQLAHEAAQAEVEKRKTAQLEAAQQKARAMRAESELKDLDKYRRKLAERKARAEKAKRKNQSSKNKKKRKTK